MTPATQKEIERIVDKWAENFAEVQPLKKAVLNLLRTTLQTFSHTIREMTLEELHQRMKVRQEWSKGYDEEITAILTKKNTDI